MNMNYESQTFNSCLPKTSRGFHLDSYYKYVRGYFVRRIFKREWHAQLYSNYAASLVIKDAEAMMLMGPLPGEF